MKCFVLFALLLLADGEKIIFQFKINFNFPTASIVSFSSPVRDASLKLSKDQLHRWTLIPDSQGKMHLVDFDSFEAPIEPSFVAENDVVFLLFTRQNPTVGQIITFDPASLQNSNFNPSHPTRFSVHGWQSDAETVSNTVLRDAFLAIGDFNVS